MYRKEKMEIDKTIALSTSANVLDEPVQQVIFKKEGGKRLYAITKEAKDTGRAIL